MRIRSVFAVGLAALMTTGILLARGKKKGEPWEGDYAEWDKSQTLKVFNQSPWVRTWAYSTQSQGEHGGGPGSVTSENTIGQDLTHDNFIVRLFTSQPVREAYVRLLQLMYNYESLPPERKKAFDAQVGGIATADPGDEVIVAVSFSSNDPQRELDLKRWFETVTTDTLNQSAYLYTSSAGQISLKKYLPPSSGLGARFVFPRTRNNEPILGRNDKEFRFQVYVPKENENLYVDFKPENLVFNGGLSY